jgi:hypothetical protein
MAKSTKADMASLKKIKNLELENSSTSSRHGKELENSKADMARLKKMPVPFSIDTVRARCGARQRLT